MRAAELAAAVDTFPKYYASIRKTTLAVESHHKTINLYLSRFRGLYPEARFPTVYFLIGKLTTGGTLGNSGLFIGTELFSAGPEADLSEIRAVNPAFVAAIGSSTKLPQIVTHELVHAQIKDEKLPKGIPALLGVTIQEGAAEFVAALISGRTAVETRADFAQANRDALFERFAKDLIAFPDGVERWLYNLSTAKDEPADLGYWLGEEICRDYFSRASDKQAALTNLMTMLDLESIVKDSSYAYLLPPKD